MRKCKNKCFYKSNVSLIEEDLILIQRWREATAAQPRLWNQSKYRLAGHSSDSEGRPQLQVGFGNLIPLMMVVLLVMVMLVVMVVAPE